MPIKVAETVHGSIMKDPSIRSEAKKKFLVVGMKQCKEFWVLT